MGKIVIKKGIKNSIGIIRPVGYVDENGGIAIGQAVDELFNEGVVNILLDFTEAPVINSMGIARLIELAEIIVDEKGGNLGYTGLSEVSFGVFKMVGLLAMGDVFSDEKKALEKLSD